MNDLVGRWVRCDAFPGRPVVVVAVQAVEVGGLVCWSMLVEDRDMIRPATITGGGVRLVPEGSC